MRECFTFTLSFVAICALAQAIGSAALGPALATYFVSANGSDLSVGDRFRPFATLDKALNAVSAFRLASGGSLPGPVNIVLQRGLISMASKVNINSAMSGTSASAPLTIVAEEGAVLSGGSVVTNWAPLTVAGSDGAFFTAILPAAKFPQTMVRQMWSAADGSRRRPHSTGLLRHVRVDTAAPDGLLVTQPGQLTNYSFAQLENATVTIFHSWVTSKKRIKRWWPHNDTLVVAGVISDRAAGSQNRYYIENIDDVPSLAPGAFIFNAATRNITYRALPGEDPRLPGQALIVPRLSSVLSLYGSVVGTPSATSGWVEHIRILNLTVAHTSAMLEEQCMMVGNGCAAQSAADLKSGAVETGNGVRNVVFDGLTVTSTGGYGVWLKPGTYNTSIVAALMRDLGAGGIRVGNPVGGLQPLSALIPSGITVADSLIEDGGKIVEAGVGILLHQATSSFLVHNTIRDLYYSGISTGWTWGYAPTSTAALTVGFNHIYRIGRGVLSDMACIYNLGISPGTLFHNNVCHDVRSAGYGSWGLYNDEGTSNVTWRDNIVWGTQAAAFHQHYGLDNLIENNVLAFPWGSCTPADICDAAAVRASTHGTPTSIGAVASFAMRGNLILLNQVRHRISTVLQSCWLSCTRLPPHNTFPGHRPSFYLTSGFHRPPPVSPLRLAVAHELFLHDVRQCYAEYDPRPQRLLELRQRYHRRWLPLHAGAAHVVGVARYRAGLDLCHRRPAAAARFKAGHCLRRTWRRCGGAFTGCTGINVACSGRRLHSYRHERCRAAAVGSTGPAAHRQRQICAGTVAGFEHGAAARQRRRAAVGIR